jgi:hypothetical protein
MVTQPDIEDKERIDMRVQVMAELDRPSKKMAQRFEVVDTAGNKFPLTIWKNNALSDFDWELEQWYKLENARGNVFQGEKSLNGSSRLRATPIDPPKEIAKNKQLFEAVEDGLPYLSLYPIDSDFAELSVYEYQIQAEGTFDDSPMDATYDLAAYLRKCTDSLVTNAGVLKIVSTGRLSVELPDPFVLAEEQQTALRAAERRENNQIERLLKHALKRAVDEDTYEAQKINRILERDPVIVGSDSLFEACLAYEARIELFPSGDAFVGVEVRYHTRSQITVNEYVDQVDADIEDFVDTPVEHDPDTYDTPGSGTLKRFADTHFTDSLPELGNQSLADWYEQKGRISENLADELRDVDPQLVEINYDPDDDETDVHVPHLLRVAPRKEVIKAVAPKFHREWDQSAKMLPNERFQKTTAFVQELGELPKVDAQVDPSPAGPSLSFMSAEVSRSNNLQFGDGRTAGVPRRGLQRHGVYEPPSNFHIHYLVPECVADEFETLRGRLERKLRDIKCPPDKKAYSEYELGKAIEYNEASAAIDDVDVALVVVPSPDADSITEGTIDDPYPEFKKAFGKQRIPTQMVRMTNLDNKWVTDNTALGLVAGAGGVPWRVGEMPGDVDCFVGLDATRDPASGQFLGASANVVLADGTVFVSKTQSLQSGETFDEDAIVDVLKNIHREFVRAEGRSPESIVIHRDGRLFEDVGKILEPFAETEIDIDILDIRKSGAPRAAVREDGNFKIDNKGRLFVAKHGDYGFLTTTGRPEFDESDGLGTPRTLRVVRRSGDTPMATLLKQVYWLSESHIGSAQRSTRLPVTTYYADRCADHARRGFLLNGELIRGVPYV